MDAKKLATHTIKVTNNLNNFPKKYRYNIVDKIINASLLICNYIVEANNFNGSTRIAYQTKAIAECEKMKIYIELALNVLHVKCSISYWNRLIDTVETQLKKWRKSTKI